MNFLEEQPTINCYAADLVSEATGGNAYWNERFSEMTWYDEPTHEMVYNLLREAGVFYAAIVQEDLSRIFSGKKPLYFLRDQIAVEEYRFRHGVCTDEDEGESMLSSMKEIGERLRDEMAKMKMESEIYGVTLSPFRHGMACLREQSYFYKTEEWANRAKLVRLLDKFVCRKCGAKDVELHVHHDEYIQSASSRLFYHNFDTCRMRCLCESCHDDFHKYRIRGCPHFQIASPSEIQEHREYLRQLEVAHDLAKECKFCFHR
jgi:5-methylcytosine-specific restriction endonuclease McrA